MSLTGFNRARRARLANTKEPPAKESNLKDMTKAELLILASVKGVEGLDERMLKADIIAAIEAVKK